MRLHCFASRERADIFAQHFDALRYDLPACPSREPVWTLPGSWSIRLRYRPLAVPRWVRENP